MKSAPGGGQPRRSASSSVNCDLDNRNLPDITAPAQDCIDHPLDIGLSDEPFDDITPGRVRDAIQTWQRIMAHARPENVAANFALGSRELQNLADTEPTEIRPIIIDALFNMATAYGIGRDDAQTIMADRTPRPPPTRFPFGKFGSIKVTSNVEYLVREVLPARGLAVIYGPPKCGKSFWTFDVAMHVALGIDYRGKSVRGGAVAYLAAEGGAGFPKRIEAYRQRRDCPPDTPFYLCPSRADLMTDVADLIAGIKAALGDSGPALVVVDTLNRTFAGDENHARDMAAYLRAAALIEDAFGCCVALIHHSGLEGGRPRGSTSLPAAADTQISVERDGAGNVIATVQLSKDGESGQCFASRLDVVEIGHDENGEPMTSCLVTPIDAGSTTRAKPKLSGQAELARRALAEAILANGEDNPAVPTGLKAVPVETWRAECYRRGVGGPEKNAMRQAFGRAKDKLAVCGIIGERDGWVWLARFN